MSGTTRQKVRRRADLTRQPEQLPLLRTSERSCYRSCPWRWNLEYNEHLHPDWDAPALRFGSLVHGALAAYYKPGVRRGPKPATTFEKLYERDLKEASKFGFRDEDGTWHEAGQTGVAIMENYIKEYGADDRWKVIHTEMPFRILVYDPETYDPNHPPTAQKGAKPWFWYVGVLDGVWEERPTSKLWIPDHKTTAGIGPTTNTHLVLDDQAGSYWTWGVDWLYEKGLLKPNTKLAGMLYNFIRKAAPDPRPQDKEGRYLNQDGSVSKKQPSPYFLRQPIFRDETDRANQRVRAENDFTILSMVREGKIPLTKSPGMFTCPNCWARDMCELHEMGSNWEEYRASTTKHWEPYSEHEVYAGR